MLILTTFDADEYVYDAMRAGASGFLLKDAPREQLVAGVRVVAGGESLLAPAITRRLIERFVSQPAPSSGVPEAIGALTDRERDVLGLLARGLSNTEIASRLFLGEATVKTHVARILAKLGVRDRMQAVILAYETGFIRPGEARPQALGARLPAFEPPDLVAVQVEQQEPVFVEPGAGCLSDPGRHRRSFAPDQCRRSSGRQHHPRVAHREAAATTVAAVGALPPPVRGEGDVGIRFHLVGDGHPGAEQRIRVAGLTPAGSGDGVRNAFVTSGVIWGGCAKNSAAVAIGSGAPSIVRAATACPEASTRS